MTLKEFITIGSVSDSVADIEKLPKPYSVGRIRTPATLNDITMGELMMLQSISTERDLFFLPCQVLLNIDECDVLKCKADEVIGFALWVAKEVQHINKLFSSTSVPPTSEEQQAGANELNFGAFGMIDYYAQRMGIHNHKEVEKVPWVIVYKCLDMDSRKMRFERRLRTIISKKK